MRSTTTHQKTTTYTQRNQKIYNGLDQNEAKISGRHEMFMKIAANEAKKSPMVQKHGCIVVHKHEIISKAYNFAPNSIKDRSVHAEINALKKIKNKSFLFKDCVLYIVRIGPDSYDNALKYSKPCPACESYINLCNIRKVFYSTNYEYDSIFIHPQKFDKLQQCRSHCSSSLFGTCFLTNHAPRRCHIMT
jgi:deoxycytidylate deaminase